MMTLELTSIISKEEDGRNWTEANSVIEKLWVLAQLPNDKNPKLQFRLHVSPHAHIRHSLNKYLYLANIHTKQYIAFEVV